MQGLISTDAAATAEEAIPLLLSTTYDLIFLDIQLGPGITGIDLLHAIRADPRYAKTPIIACTASSEPGKREALLAEGFDDFLAKPFTREDIQAMVRKHLAKQQSERQMANGILEEWM